MPKEPASPVITYIVVIEQRSKSLRGSLQCMRVQNPACIGTQHDEQSLDNCGFGYWDYEFASFLSIGLLLL